MQQKRILYIIYGVTCRKLGVHFLPDSHNMHILLYSIEQMGHNGYATKQKKENESNTDCNEHDEQTAFGIILFVYIGVAIKGPDQEHDESDEGQGGDENGNSPIPDGQDTNSF